jgi:hypothetical protein
MKKKNDFNPLVIIISFPPLFCWLGANRKKKKWEKSTCRAISLDKEWKKKGRMNACLCLQRNEPTCSNKLLMKWLRGGPPPLL